MTALIGLDWGTTNARGFRFAVDGGLVETRERPLGILQVKDGAFAAAFATLVGDWRDAAPDAPVLMCGMIGSRQGWHEATYATLPAGGADLAATLARVPGVAGDVRIVPGATGAGLAGAPDVMRGEETQIVGALESGESGDALFVLPGTHSKWVEVRGGRIQRFATFMTGEVYAALRGHTILGRLMADGAEDEAGFAAGLARAREPGGLLHHLFSARTLGLFDRLKADALAPYLSGLLIGHEIAAARAAFGDGAVAIVGGATLARRYAAALGPSARTIAGEASAARGLWRIARAAGLVR